MRVFIRFLCLLIASQVALFGEVTDSSRAEEHHYISPSYQKIAPFTGKVAKERVRLRLEPNLDGDILRELAKGELMVITGEEEDYYAVKPPSDFKGYIYRTYVLNDMVEGNYVNIRLAPNLEGPVIAQANTGDRLALVQPSPFDSKWLEFQIPSEVRFFVSKNYIDKVGDENYIITQKRRQQQANELLDATELLSHHELQKPFEDISLGRVFENLNRVIQEYGDFPGEVRRAQELIDAIQDDYIDKKMAFLEAKTDSVTEEWELKNAQLSAEIEAQKRRFADLREQIEPSNKPELAEKPEKKMHPQLTQEVFSWEHPDLHKGGNLSHWLPQEQALYEQWIADNGQLSMETFYEHQYLHNSVAMRGTIEPFMRSVKNKPGDYLLLSPATKHPIAYLYSTQLDLKDYAGHEVTIVGLPRQNNNFAFPAYHVISVQ